MKRTKNISKLFARSFAVLLTLAMFSSTSSQALELTVTGQVVVDKEVAKKLPKKGVLFIFARAAKSAKGFPLAVKRIADPKFPVEFSMSQKDSMVDGTLFQGPVKIIARFSPTGDVMAKAGAFEGEIGTDGKLKVGQKDKVTVTINKAL